MSLEAMKYVNIPNWPTVWDNYNYTIFGINKQEPITPMPSLPTFTLPVLIHPVDGSKLLVYNKAEALHAKKQLETMYAVVPQLDKAIASFEAEEKRQAQEKADAIALEEAIKQAEADRVKRSKLQPGMRVSYMWSPNQPKSYGIVAAPGSYVSKYNDNIERVWAYFGGVSRPTFVRFDKAIPESN